MTPPGFLSTDVDIGGEDLHVTFLTVFSSWRFTLPDGRSGIFYQKITVILLLILAQSQNNDARLQQKFWEGESSLKKWPKGHLGLESKPVWTLTPSPCWLVGGSLRGVGVEAGARAEHVQLQA